MRPSLVAFLLLVAPPTRRLRSRFREPLSARNLPETSWAGPGIARVPEGHDLAGAFRVPNRSARHRDRSRCERERPCRRWSSGPPRPGRRGRRAHDGLSVSASQSRQSRSPVRRDPTHPKRRRPARSEREQRGTARRGSTPTRRLCGSELTRRPGVHATQDGPRP